MKGERGIVKIALFGSTGYVGKVLLKKCIEQGHQMRVLVRDTKKLGEYVKMVEVVEGDYFDKVKITEAISGMDIVISTIGPSKKKPEDVVKYESAMKNAMSDLVAAMRDENIKRIILIGGAATPVADNEVFNYRQKFIKFMLNYTARYIITIKTNECSILSGSGLDWTIVRPPAVTKGSPAGNVRADEKILHGMRVDVADLADFILGQIASDKWLHKAPLVCSDKK